uniref:Chromosome 3 open reading frame 20 n=1 Tax=Podarcis muralis TaxID=64176 RepID=A0A670I6H6_PODMU
RNLPSPRASPVKSVDYAQIKAKAPRVLADMVQMLILWRKMGFHVPRGVKNIFEFTWDELLVTPPRKSFAGLYCPVVKFASTEDADISSTPTSRAQKVGPTPSRLKANYVTPSSEDQQMLLKFQKRSVHLLTELLKMKMKLMIESSFHIYIYMYVCFPGKAYDERLDPCPEARELLREICRTIVILLDPCQSYPSGSVAVYQFPICCVGKTITLLFQDAPSQTLLGTITSQGHSWIRYCFKASCSIALMMNNEGGSIRDKDGYLTQHWSWYSKNQILQSLDYQINEQLKLKVVNQNSMTITFTEQSESITLSLVREGCTHRSKSDRQVRSHNSGDQEGQWVRALTEIKKRFEKIVRQFINGILMVSGILIPDLWPLNGDQLSSHILHGILPLISLSGGNIGLLQGQWGYLLWGKCGSSRNFTLLSLPPTPTITSLSLTTASRASHRSKGEVSAAKDAVRPPEPWAISLADCPVVLHKIMSKVGDDLCCRCVVKIPLITDLEFEKFITAPRDPDQVIVICVISPQDHSYSPFFEWSIENLYIQMQHGRPSPCIQCKHDPFRFLRYDLECPLNKNPPLLVQKHAVVPGMVVMYAGGKPVFGGCVFNGYSFSKKDLLKQINQVCLDCKMGHFLPQNLHHLGKGTIIFFFTQMANAVQCMHVCHIGAKFFSLFHKCTNGA